MITIICGEDTVGSRQYIVDLKKTYLQKSYEIRDIPPQEYGIILEKNTSLFSLQTVYFTEHLESIITRKKLKKKAENTKDLIDQIAERKDIVLFDWEEKQARMLKLKDIAVVKEFKPATDIFKLLQTCTPGKKHDFVTLLRQLSSVYDITFIFIMIQKHIRSLITASDNLFTPTTLPWQRSKLKTQSSLWNNSKLLEFYLGLSRIDVISKKGLNPYGISKSLEILACYYL